MEHTGVWKSHSASPTRGEMKEGTDLQLEVRLDGCETVAVCLTGFRPVCLPAGGRDH